MSSTEITNWQNDTIYNTIIDYHDTTGWHYSIEEKNNPVTWRNRGLSWYDSARFCNRLSDATGLERCYDETTWECDFSKNGFRLPTEAEWEYACRAGTTTNYYTGDNERDLDRAGWYTKNSGGHSHPVGQKEPNGWSLYDMHGNVSEFCNDWYDSQYYSKSPSKNPTGPSTSSTTAETDYREKQHVTRGGSLYHDISECKSSSRLVEFKGGPSGFRIVRGSFTP